MTAISTRDNTEYNIMIFSPVLTCEEEEDAEEEEEEEEEATI